MNIIVQSRNPIPIINPLDKEVVKPEEPKVTKELDPVEVKDLPAVEPVAVEPPQEVLEEKSETDETDRGAMLVEEIVQPAQPIETPKELITSSNVVDVVPEQEVVVEVASVKEEPQSKLEQLTEMDVAEPETVENVETTTEEVEDTAETPKSLITYNEGQWSPANPSGQCKYDRQQLLQLREAKLSTATPVLKNKKATCIVFSGSQRRPAPNNSLMPQFAKRGQSIGSYSSNNPAMPAFAKPQGGVPPSRHSAKGSKSGMIHVHLSLREEIKLNESENAWKPAHLKTETTPEEDLKKRVRGILNRLTPEKFEVLVSEIMKLQIDTSNKLNDVMILVFEKAIDEPKFSSSYASLCHRLATDIRVKDDKNETSVHFRSVLIDKTECEFFRNVTDKTAKDTKLQPLILKLKECTNPNDKAEISASIEEEERKFRRRSVGTVTFIGELYKIGMLTLNIISICISSLLDPNSEDKLECMCKLLTTVGKKYDDATQQPTKKDGMVSRNLVNLDNTTKQMQSIANRKVESVQQISSRVRFMLQDVIDLRRNKWVPSQTKQDGPKTMDQISKEAKNEQITTNYLNYGGHPSQQSQPQQSQQQKNGGGVRHNMGGNFNRNSNSGMRMGGDRMNNQGQGEEWILQTSKSSSRMIDANKLEQMLNTNTDISVDTPKLGSSTQFTMWNTSGQSSKPAPPPTSNSFAALTLLDNKFKGDQQRMQNYGNKKNSYNKNSYDRDRSSSRSNRSQEYVSTQRQSSQQQQQQHHQQHQQQKPIDLGKQYKTQVSKTKLKHPQKAPAANFAELSIDDNEKIEKAIKKIIENSFDTLNFDESLPIFLEFPENQRWGFVFLIFYEYLHLAKLTGSYRTTAAEFIVYLLNHNYISLEHFSHGYKSFSEIASDLLLDVPDAWHYIFECAIVLIGKNIINVLDLWNDDLKVNRMGNKFIKEYLSYSVRHIGPTFTRTSWKKLNLKWSMFLDAEDIDSFIKSNKLEYVEDPNHQPVIVIKGDPELHIQSVMAKAKSLLHNGYNNDSVIDYLKGNIIDVNKSFLHALTTTLCEYAISEPSPGAYKLDPERFKEVSKILHCYLDSQPERELECLFALQTLIFNLEHPPMLLSLLFSELYFADVISPDSFFEWKDSKEYQNAGKGVAMMGLRNFFTDLESAETSDDENSKSRGDNISTKSGTSFRKNKRF
ncbi:EIF4G3 family protein [Megaselia abdita]